MQTLFLVKCFLSFLALNWTNISLAETHLVNIQELRNKPLTHQSWWKIINILSEVRYLPSEVQCCKYCDEVCSNDSGLFNDSVRSRKHNSMKCKIFQNEAWMVVVVVLQYNCWSSRFVRTLSNRKQCIYVIILIILIIIVEKLRCWEEKKGTRQTILDTQLTSEQSVTTWRSNVTATTLRVSTRHKNNTRYIYILMESFQNYCFIYLHDQLISYHQNASISLNWFEGS